MNSQGSSVWDLARMGGSAGTRHALGLWDPRHKLASLAWVPPVSQRRQIQGKKRYCFCINFPTLGNVTGGGTVMGGVALTTNFWWTDTIFSSPVAGGQVIQLFDTKNNVKYMNVAEFDENLGGTTFAFLGLGNVSTQSNLPYIERRITRIPAGAVLQATLQTNNGTPSSDPAQLVLGGYID